jgi:hypothetical protein
METNHFTDIRGNILPLTLLASALIGLLTLSGLLLMPITTDTTRTTMSITLPGQTIMVDTEFKMELKVSSQIPVNAFAGVVIFDEDILQVVKIDYNTSIADLWAKEPWHNRGEGTIAFIGGSTMPGGFIGTGALLSVTFKALAVGNTSLTLRDAQILAHDGRGTDVPIQAPIDNLFTVTSSTPPGLSVTSNSSTISIITEPVRTDLNADTKTTLADVSIFMLYLSTGDNRADVNQDGKINTSDLSLIMGARSH